MVRIMKLPLLAGVVLAAMLVAGCLLETPTPDPSPTPADGASEPAASTQAPVSTTAADPVSTAPTSVTPTPVVVNVEGREYKQYAALPLMTIDPTATYTATIRTNHGLVSVNLFAARAPKTVNSFVFLAQEGFYDGIIFHRVIQDFMIQGGDPTGTGTRGPGYQYEDEIDPSLEFDRPGVLAMANRGAGTRTNGSQFFITVAPTPHLKGNHTIFGRVTGGQGVITGISLVRTGQGDRPVDPVIIQSIDILKDGS